MASYLAVILLVLSNVFMTFAWYGHLKYPSESLVKVIFVSWGIALFEYCLQVPANRIGITVFTAPQLKIIQEVITFVVFFIFSLFYLGQKPTRYDLVGFCFILFGISVALYPKLNALK